MEIDVGNYGRMIFELVLSNKCQTCPKHWESIMDKAKPLVKELLALNDEMKVDGRESKYTITGQVGEKYFMTESEKIETAMQKTLEVSVEQLKEGDFVFNTFSTNHSLIEVVYNNELAHVVEITKKGIYLGIRLYSEDLVKFFPFSISPTFYKYKQKYEDKGSDFWLKKAHKLGLE